MQRGGGGDPLEGRSNLKLKGTDGISPASGRRSHTVSGEVRGFFSAAVQGSSTPLTHTLPRDVARRTGSCGGRRSGISTPANPGGTYGEQRSPLVCARRPEPGFLGRTGKPGASSFASRVRCRVVPSFVKGIQVAARLRGFRVSCTQSKPADGPEKVRSIARKTITNLIGPERLPRLPGDNRRTHRWFRRLVPSRMAVVSEKSARVPGRWLGARARAPPL